MVSALMPPQAGDPQGDRLRPAMNTAPGRMGSDTIKALTLPPVNPKRDTLSICPEALQPQEAFRRLLKERHHFYLFP